MNRRIDERIKEKRKVPVLITEFSKEKQQAQCVKGKKTMLEIHTSRRPADSQAPIPHQKSYFWHPINLNTVSKLDHPINFSVLKQQISY